MISFGLVNAPVRMYAAVSEQGLKFNLLHDFGLWVLGFGLLSVKREQRFLDRLGDKFADFKLTVKFHLALGRMDVHVHCRWI